MLRAAVLATLCLLAQPVRACDTALLLAIDVSQSIDQGEYRIQVDGMADALRDAQVAEALVQGQIAVAVIQWSGPEAQHIAIPWTRVRTAQDVSLLSQRARRIPRAFVMSNTAVGALIRFAGAQFAAVADCRRKVIDISGDGNDNAATGPEQARREMEAAGIEINALAIEGLGVSITNFYRRSVITRGGFVMTSRGHGSYAETLRRKILREISQALF